MNQIAVILTDAHRRILWVNHDFEAITGYSLGEVLGCSPAEFLHGPKTEPDVLERIRQGLASEKPFKETITNYRKSGDSYRCQLVIHPIHNKEGAIVNYLAFEVDCSKKHHAGGHSLLSLEARYRTSSLQGTDELRLYERINTVMNNEQLFLDPDLTLRKLSLRLDTNTKYLSQVINRHANCNFLTFVNGFRIAEVQRRFEALEFQQRTFFGIAQRCGFKNKSTFYKAFRDALGQTPKAFVESMPVAEEATANEQ
ncbi:PAS domain S-box protein [Neolewinella lacunae]|uniref:PAS domain S-box protein n=1 Tax=Neolewinella lacunae TaxID=1517758 RepID=A0A923T9G3_9BACT|nr:helix-turn-helix domain-containing protein [Neolewinella lacunae]MBC6996700.1 PAS domain S-box protein [Neolewinella lacunae]MDN3633435.1 PAS domain S-box protein [Neolewinella lacunae]